MNEAKPVLTPVPEKWDGTIVANPLKESEIARYQALVGALMHVSTHTRPDLAFAMLMLTRNMQAPTEHHWALGKRVLRYLKGTIDSKLYYKSPLSFDLELFCDADWAGPNANRKSISGWVL